MSTTLSQPAFPGGQPAVNCSPRAPETWFWCQTLTSVQGPVKFHPVSSCPLTQSDNFLKKKKKSFIIVFITLSTLIIYTHHPGASSWPRRQALPLPARACLASLPEEAPEQGEAPSTWGEGQLAGLGGALRPGCRA